MIMINFESQMLQFFFFKSVIDSREKEHSSHVGHVTQIKSVNINQNENLAYKSWIKLLHGF